MDQPPQHAESPTVAMLDPTQARLLGCLVEKEATTPDQYPLTENSLRNAANQKTSRSPVMNLSQGQVGHALRQLEADGWVKQAWATRAAKWEHRLGQKLELYSKAQAVIATLMLRGFQTAAEIRAHCHRLYEFDDVDDVEYELERLATRERPLVMQLERQPGQKGCRFAQLLTGPPDLTNMPVHSPSPSPVARPPIELVERLDALELELTELRSRIEQLEGDG